MAAVDADDLVRLKAELDADPASALQWLFPAGRLIGPEFQVGDITGAPGSSLKFNIRKRKGSDFKAGAKGFSNTLDVFVAHAGSFPRGLELARQYAGIPEPERPKPEKGKAKGGKGDSDAWTQIIPPPAGIGRPDFARLWPNATFRKAWAYRDAAGGILFHVARYEWEEVGKDGKAKLRKATPVISWGFGGDGRRWWRAKGAGLNILFGLEQLAARPDAPVLVVEGEKAAEVARLLFPAWVVVAWKGGAGNAGNIDVTPLTGRDVVLWPDADHAGYGAMEAISRAALKAGADVRLVRLPDGLPDGWDLADELPDGWAADTLEGLLTSAEVCGNRRRAIPHYPAVPLAIDQANSLLHRTIHDWAGHAVRRGEGEAARQVGVKGAAGTGKTSVARRVLQAFPEAQGKHVYYFVPQHRLADEFQRAAEGGPLRVQVIKGRKQKRPDGSTMCAKAPEAAEVARAGFNVQETMCRRVDPETGEEELCEHFATCPYVAQFDNPEPAVWIMAHESMFLPRNAGLPKPDAVVIDESFHANAVQQKYFALDRLDNGLAWSFGRKVDMADQAERARIAGAVRRALEAGEHPRDHGVTAEECRFVAKLEIGGKDGIGITPGMSHAAQRKRLAGYRRNEAAKLYRFWKILEGEIERAGPLQQIELRRRDDEQGLWIHLHWRRELELPDVPVLVLDADLDSTIARKFLPRLEMVEVPVERRAEVIQVRDTPCSRQKLLAWEAAPDDRVSRSANRLADIQALLDVEAANGARVLVVTYKPAVERLKAPPGCAVDYFGNIRGTDAYKPFDTVIIAGRQQPAAHAAEAMARALFADDPEPLKLGGKLVEQERKYRMRDGGDETAKVWVHPDPRVQALLEQVRERESGQAIDRLRLIHRGTPARVLVLSDVVLDVTVDRLVTWREMMPTRFEQAAARGPAVPLSASELARCFPDLWVSANAVKLDFKRTERGVVSYREYLYTKRPLLNRARYRRAGQRCPTPALIRSDAPDPRAALESVVGPVVWFELEQVVPAEEPEALDVIKLQAPGKPVAVETEPAPEAKVLPLHPPPADELPTPDELARLRAILGQESRLAGLSSRLEAAYQRLRPPDQPEQVPRRVAR